MSAWSEAHATGFERAQAEETPALVVTATANARQLSQPADIGIAGINAAKPVDDFLKLARGTDMLCFQP
jgi:hypothetical protein